MSSAYQKLRNARVPFVPETCNQLWKQEHLQVPTKPGLLHLPPEIAPQFELQHTPSAQ